MSTHADQAWIERAHALLPRYTMAAPRYTSYPTAPTWTDDFGATDLRGALGRTRGDTTSIYVHIPYCERLCTYCACNRVITRDHGVAGPYLERIAAEVDLVARAVGRPLRAAQLAIGGGTPTFLRGGELAQLLDTIDERFEPMPGAERSIEVDPRVTTDDQLRVLCARGINRISLGVQDLDPRVQRAIHRVQSEDETRRVTDTARALGCSSVNFDLIYGLPFQTAGSFARTLDSVITMRPDRIALYSYAHVTWVSRQQRGFERGDLPDPARKLEIFVLALRELRAAGYVYIGLDHFALPGDPLACAVSDESLNRSFMGYTTSPTEDLLALGASGISEVAEVYAQSARGVGEYAAAIDRGELPTARGWKLSADDVARRWLIRDLMCRSRIDPAAFSARFGRPLDDVVPDLSGAMRRFVDDGLVEPLRDGYRTTMLGRLLLRPIAMTFDAYLDAAPIAHAAAHRESVPPRFSQSV